MADAARARKVADRIHQTVARLLQGRIKDPRLGFVTVTDVKVTGDLQHATIFYTVYGTDRERRESAAALRSATGLIRSEVGKALGIRLTPSLEFQLDALPTQAKTFEDALAQAHAKDEEIARSSQGAQYAAGKDPYRHDDEDAVEPEDADEDDAPSVADEAAGPLAAEPVLAKDEAQDADSAEDVVRAELLAEDDVVGDDDERLADGVEDVPDTDEVPLDGGDVAPEDSVR